MKNKIYVTIICLSIVIMGSILFSCQKNQLIEKDINMQTMDVSITEINEFIPLSEDMASVYNSFLKQKVIIANGLKTSLTDPQIDSALWKAETYFNTNYGFSNDSCYFLDETEDTISFTITGYGPTGIPIIDIDELTDFLDDIETEIADENSDVNNEYFWCCFYEVDEIGQTKVRTKLKKVRTISFYGVYPPGFNPLQFEHYTCMDAFYQGYCDDKHWWGAPEEYQNRIQTYSIWHGNDCIMVYTSSYAYQNGDPHFNGIDYLFEHDWNQYMLGTDIDPTKDELNQYLQSTKNAVDVVNPNGANNYYLGYVDVHHYYNQVFDNYQHYFKGFYFKKVCTPGEIE